MRYRFNNNIRFRRKPASLIADTFCQIHILSLTVSQLWRHLKHERRRSGDLWESEPRDGNRGGLYCTNLETHMHRECLVFVLVLVDVIESYL